jgi:type III pantothenate kinase
MIVTIDCGNTRIKWGVHDGRQWRAQGAVGYSEISALAALPGTWQARAVWLASVAGEAATQSVCAALSAWQPLIKRVSTGTADGGVINAYDNPAQLGVDRWLALIGARGMTPAACLVVMAGTATTIDTLTAEGEFAGGLILPGLDLMRRSLARDTAALPLAEGEYTSLPRNTGNAIVTGCIEAQLGAIERAFRRIANEPDALCLISGGNAQPLAAQLALPHRRIDNLVLEGLARLARITVGD